MAKVWGWALCLIMVCFTTQIAVLAYQFTLGGSNGWTVPSGSNTDSYNQWASRNRFQIGDTLFFKYNKSEDSVLQVTQGSYSTCNTSGPIASYTDGNTVFKFPIHGPFYFISGNHNRCQMGEKLIVVVLAPCHFGHGKNCKPASTPVSSPSPTLSPALSPPLHSPSASPSSSAPASSPTTASPSPSSSPSLPSPSPSPVGSSPSPSSPFPSPTGLSSSPSPSPSPVGSSPSVPSPSPSPTGLSSSPSPSPPPAGSSPSPSSLPTPNSQPLTPQAGASPPVPAGGGGGSITPSASAPPPPPTTSATPSTSSTDRLTVLPSFINLMTPLLFAALLNVKIGTM